MEYRQVKTWADLEDLFPPVREVLDRRESMNVNEEQPKKKIGRPKGSKNKKPSKKRIRKDMVEFYEKDGKKKCKKCLQTKSISQYRKFIQSHDGYSYWCKSCLIEYDKARYSSDKQSKQKPEQKLTINPANLNLQKFLTELDILNDKGIKMKIEYSKTKYGYEYDESKGLVTFYPKIGE